MIGYYGYRGSGKTLSLVAEVYSVFQKNPDLIVLTNTPFTFPPHKKTGKILSQYHYSSISELEEFFLFCLSENKEHILSKEAIVVIDEANLAIPSRLFSKLPPFFLSFMAESRKLNVEIMFTTQHPLRVDLILRELCETWYHCDRLPLFGILRRTEEELTPQATPIASMGSKYMLRPSVFFSYYDTYHIVGMDPSLLPPKDQKIEKMTEFLRLNYLPNLAGLARKDLAETLVSPINEAARYLRNVLPSSLPSASPPAGETGEGENPWVRGIRPRSN